MFLDVGNFEFKVLDDGKLGIFVVLMSEKGDVVGAKPLILFKDWDSYRDFVDKAVVFLEKTEHKIPLPFYNAFEEKDDDSKS